MTTKELLVRKQLGITAALIELASLTLLFTLIPQNLLPDKFGVLLTVLLPITFGLHVMEEFIFPGHFISWDNLYRPAYIETPGSYYVKVNALPGIASVLLVLGAFDYAGGYSAPGIRAWLTILTFMSWNALFHLRGAIRTRRYSPGMITGLGIFVPLALASYVYFVGAGYIDAVSAVLCIAVALTIQPVLDSIKKRRAKRSAG